MIHNLCLPVISSKVHLRRFKSFDKFCKAMCMLNNFLESSNIFERDFTTYSPNLSISKRVIKVNGNNYTYTNNTFPQELEANITFEIQVTNSGNLSTIKTNFNGHTSTRRCFA